jgi:Zn-dependent protease
VPDPASIDWGLFGLWYVVFLFSLTVHEGAHALAAHLGGDDTAYRGGQVTLNPIPHMRREPFGTLLFPAISFLYFGWMMGWASTPFDPHWAGRHPRRAALMAAAGPSANFLLAGVALVAAKLLVLGGALVAPPVASFDLVVSPPGGEAAPLALALAHGLSMVLTLNALLGLFNLVPVPPLDGGGVLLGLLPEGPAGRLRGMLASPMVGLLGMLVVWYGFGMIFSPVFRALLGILHPGAYGP